MSMITAFEFYYLVATRKTSRKPDCAHGCLGARIYHAKLFNIWHKFAYLFGKVNLSFCGRSKAETLGCCFADFAYNLCMGVTKDYRAPRPDIVYIGFPHDIVKVGTFGATKEYWFSTYGSESPNRRIYSSGDDSFCFFKQFLVDVHV